MRGNKKPMMNLGLFINYMHNPFQNTLISCVSDAAHKFGASIWCFEFSFFNNETLKIDPALFSALLSKRNINGLIIIPGALEQYLCTEQFYLHLTKPLPIPIVFLLCPVKTAPFIRSDNNDGIKKLLFHLFTDHGYRCPAFIKGTPYINDFNARFHMFTSICNNYGIHIESSLLYEGNYSFGSGRQAALKFINENTVKCDVIIAANDLMAAGAMLELQTHGIRVPGDIAVTGFDDMETARFMNPPLTTVKQPLYEISYKAVEYIESLLKGADVPEKTILPGELIIRESCGCIEPENKNKEDDLIQYMHPRDTEPYIIHYKKQDLTNYSNNILDKIMRYLGQHYADSELTIGKVEKATGISSIKIAKIIKENFNLHFKTLLNKIRCSEAKRLLKKTDRYITDIAFQVGYNSRNHFYKAFIQSEGISPKKYKNL